MSTAIQPGIELRGERTPISRLLRDLWRSRELMRTLARKDFYVRFRRASFGMLWAIGLPLVQAVVLAVIFSRIVRFETGVPYTVFVLSGVLPWTFFSTAVNAGTMAIVEGSELATKIYFPRAVLPIVSVWSGFYGYVPALVILLGLAAVLGASLGPELLLMFPATLLLLTLCTGFALVLAGLQVYFRDMRYVVTAALLPWFWASGVIYPLDVLGTLGKWLELNPAVGMIDFYRASLGGAQPGWGSRALIAAGWAIVLHAVALPMYCRRDRVFVDLL